MKVEIRCGKFIGKHARDGYRQCHRLLAIVEAHEDGKWTTETRSDLSGFFDHYPESMYFPGTDIAKQSMIEYPKPICPSNGHGELAGVNMIAIQWESWRGESLSPYMVDTA
jgi:hypothetical protein